MSEPRAIATGLLNVRTAVLISGSPPYEGGVATASGTGSFSGSPPYEGGVAAASADGVVLALAHTPSPFDKISLR
jgi:hypothetical protein